jgi:hypothetical protein
VTRQDRGLGRRAALLRPRCTFANAGYPGVPAISLADVTAGRTVLSEDYWRALGLRGQLGRNDPRRAAHRSPRSARPMSSRALRDRASLGTV